MCSEAYRSFRSSTASNAQISAEICLKMKEKSWACTLITQLSLCIVAYIAMNIGQPQKFTRRSISNEGSRQNGMYFMSVVGGFRPLKEQTLLLQQVWLYSLSWVLLFLVKIGFLFAFFKRFFWHFRDQFGFVRGLIVPFFCVAVYLLIFFSVFVDEMLCSLSTRSGLILLFMKENSIFFPQYFSL